MPKAIQINKSDNVAVALSPLTAGMSLPLGDTEVILKDDIPQGHKFAVRPIRAGESVIKYGYPIGTAKRAIGIGEWVHMSNLATALSEEAAYTYRPAVTPVVPSAPETFMGYRRSDGRAGVRNELWIIPAVGCVNDVAERLARENAHLTQEFGIDGVYAFPHPYGCSQMGDDHKNTQRLLAALVQHPNAGGVLLVGLGCENNTISSLQEVLGEWDEQRVKFMVCQEVEDEIAAGSDALRALAAYAKAAKREPLPVSLLTIGMKCGGSDGLSGITANPTVGAFSDLLIAEGGSTILTEVPEMFGAETILMNRAADGRVYEKIVGMINGFKQYFVSHGQVVYENPSPGNKQGGISTLEDKSLGCVQKGGTAPVSDVIGYAQQVQAHGLTLLASPGNDLVSATALAAAGAQILLFTTGRGTPFGAPVPTLKISSNSALFAKKPAWIDFNAGTVAEGEPLDKAAERLMQLVVETASGKATCTEKSGYRGIAIFKDGVTL